jgi:hypothetical protein
MVMRASNPELPLLPPEAFGKAARPFTNCTGESRLCNYAKTQFCLAETITLFLPRKVKYGKYINVF